MQAANYAFPLVVIPYLLRSIGVAAFGEIAFTGAVVLAFGVVVDFGFNHTATARIAARPDDVDAVSTVYSLTIGAKVVLMLGCSAVLALCTALIPALRSVWLLVLVQWPLLLGEVLFPMWLFQGVQKLTFVTVFHVVSRIVTLLMLFVFVHSPADAPLAAAIQASHLVIAGTFAQVTARHLLGVRFRWPERGFESEFLRGSARVFLGNLGCHVYVRAPMVLVGFLASPQLVGAFAVAHRIAGVLTALATPFTQSLYPQLCAMAARAPGPWLQLRNRTVLGISLSLLVAVVSLNVFADRVVALLSGDVDRSVSLMILLFSPVVVLSGANTTLSRFVMALGRFMDFQRTFVAAAILFFVLAIPLTIGVDAYGLIVATLAVEIFVLVRCIDLSKSSGQNTGKRVSTMPEAAG